MKKRNNTVNSKPELNENLKSQEKISIGIKEKTKILFEAIKEVAKETIMSENYQEELYKILSDRIKKYMIQIVDYKFLPDEEWAKKSSHFLNETFQRYSSFLGRKVDNSENSNNVLTNKNDLKEICKVWDEILCDLEPKFKNVVEYKPVESKSEKTLLDLALMNPLDIVVDTLRNIKIDVQKNLDGKKEDNIQEIESLFNSIPHAKNITRLYLYATYFSSSENIPYVDALKKAIAVINFPEEKDIGDLENSYKTWRSSSKKLIDKVNTIKNEKVS